MKENLVCVTLILLFFPFLLDSCMNRDPAVYVDKFYTLRAAWAGDDFSLCQDYRAFNTLPEFRSGGHKRKRIPDQIHGVTSLSMNDDFIIGLCEQGAFVVSRTTHEQFFYENADQRDNALRSVFLADLQQFAPPKDFIFDRANIFYPYNIIYYITVVAIIASTTLRSRIGSKANRVAGSD